MSVIFSDNFNRADAALAGTNWKDEASVWSVVSNELSVSSASFRVAQTTTSAHAAIDNCSVEFKRTSSTFDGGVVMRANITGATSATGNCYIFNPFGTVADVIRRVAGVNSTLAGGLTGLTSAIGDVWKCIIQGTGATVTFDIYQNGNLRGQISDAQASRIVVPGQTGFVTFNASSRFDDFVVDNLISASVLRKNSLLRLGVGR